LEGVGGIVLRVRRGERADADDAADFFYEDPPMIWFFDGSALEGNDFIPLKTTHPPMTQRRFKRGTGAGSTEGKNPRERRKRLIPFRRG